MNGSSTYRCQICLMPSLCCSRTLQVRTGDSVLFDHEGGRIANFDSYAAYFNCAAQIEETRRINADQTVRRPCCSLLLRLHLTCAGREWRDATTCS